MAPVEIRKPVVSGSVCRILVWHAVLGVIQRFGERVGSYQAQPFRHPLGIAALQSFVSRDAGSIGPSDRRVNRERTAWLHRTRTGRRLVQVVHAGKPVRKGANVGYLPYAASPKGVLHA